MPAVPVVTHLRCVGAGSGMNQRPAITNGMGKLRQAHPGRVHVNALLVTPSLRRRHSRPQGMAYGSTAAPA